MKKRWICCQLGAREHYSIPRALHRAGSPTALVTDFWTSPGGAWKFVPSEPVRQRYHSELGNIEVVAMNWRTLAFEPALRARWRGWERIQARNHWFQRHAVRDLQKRLNTEQQSGVVFSYSYTAREIFRCAKEAGWTTVLGQIDAGPVSERLVSELYRGFPEFAPAWRAAPPSYWKEWLEECQLANRVVVNSTWARDALVEAGVPERKLYVIPLAYEPPKPTIPPRSYPPAFTPARPLRVLFLGQVNLGKGMALVFEAIRLLRDEPVEFRVVGEIQLVVPDDLMRNRIVEFVGPVPRDEVTQHYEWADIFLFPTFSDGFGITQLEAQAFRLPVIASRFCGDVVEHGRNGLLLDQLNTETIVDAIRYLLRLPSEIEKMSAASGLDERFSIDWLGSQLKALVESVGAVNNV